MNEKEIRALGFEPWYGGDEAPGDFDKDIPYNALRRSGMRTSNWSTHWVHEGRTSDIIGYKKKETPMEYPKWVYARAYELAANRATLCQHILDHEQPPVDPDLELARKHYDMWMRCDHDSAEIAILAAIKEARNA